MKQLCLLGVLSTLLAATSAQGAVIISNLPCCGQITVQNAAISNNLAAGFVMPAGQDYSLNSITMQMTVFPGAFGISVTLHGGSATAPSGGALLTLDNPVFGSGSTAYTFTPLSVFTLLADTNYWIVLQGDGNTQNTVNWNSALNGVTPTGLATFLGQTADANFPPTTAFVSPYRFAFEVNADPISNNPVPEPSTWALMSAGSALLYALRRRKP